MDIKLLEVAGIGPALKAMRNPYDSWERSDSWEDFNIITVGEDDRTLSEKLQEAGPEHCKHLRMIQVWADIRAPRYWWTEFDTYRIGVEKISCSTMHRLMSKTLTLNSFEACNGCCYDNQLAQTIQHINGLILKYQQEKDPAEKRDIWERVIQILPQSYLQTRTVMMSYAALRNIYRQREGHKLRQWSRFRKWVEKLPESWMITE